MVESEKTFRRLYSLYFNIFYLNNYNITLFYPFNQ